MEEISLTEKNKTLKHLKRIVKQYDKPEHILNIIVQGSDNKVLLIKIVFNEGKHKIVPLVRNLIAPGFSLTV